LAPDPVSTLAEALGPDVELERPSEAAHGDYATNAALKLAGARRIPPRQLASELVQLAESLSPDIVHLLTRREMTHWRLATAQFN